MTYLRNLLLRHRRIWGGISGSRLNEAGSAKDQWLIIDGRGGR